MAEPSPPTTFDQLSPDEQTKLTQAVMHKQFALSLQVGIVFFALLFGLPLVNRFLPALANMGVGGFTLTWLVLGILFFPLTWVLSAYFIRESERIEHEIAQEHRQATSNAEDK
jgi:uncharacterized membrane protein (DUF485 family)